MSEQETHEKIIAEMQNPGNPSVCPWWADGGDCEYCPLGKGGENCSFYKFADRFEAAHKRERGNAAKLREAALAIRADILKRRSENCWYATDSDILEKIDAALSASSRNCDKVKTSWDVLKEWHEGLDTANDIVRMLDWLLAPATEKEGGAK